MTQVSVSTFIQDFTKELLQQNVAIFSGAGMSVAAGFVDWKGLLQPLANELNLDLTREYDLVRIAQYHVNLHGHNRADLNDAILNGFSRKQATITENHRILSRLPIKTYWTTNYDTCIEDALKENSKLPDVKFSPEHLMMTVQKRGAVVYKMHGDCSDPSNAVLCKDDFETFHLKRGDFLTALAGDFLSKMFLFIGFSFTDPNLDYVLSRLHTRYGQNQRKHYCFVRRESAHKDDKAGDLEYRIAKQEHFVRDLERYNIRAVMIETYEEITDILKKIEDRYKSKTVFVSGSAHQYGDQWSTFEALEFVHNLGKKLIANDFKVVTGLGLGIGSSLVDGALQQIYRVQKENLSDQLIIRPFPQSVEGQNLWKTYREDMLNYPGIAIFMFGNKPSENGDSIVPSTGVIEEFDIAHIKGVKVLPLGFTEYVARQLYDRVEKDFDLFYPNATAIFKQLFLQLGDNKRTLSEQLNTTIETLKELQKM